MYTYLLLVLTNILSMVYIFYISDSQECKDTHNYCRYWAAIRECSNNPDYM